MKRGNYHESMAIFFVIAIVFCGCKGINDRDVVIREFPKESLLSSEIIYVPPVLLSPENMVIYGNHMLVLDSRKDTLFSIFELPSCRFLGGAGLKGRGPGEFSIADARSLTADKDGIFLFDGGGANQIKRIHIVDDKLSFETSAYIKSLTPVNGFLDLGNDEICYAPYDVDMKNDLEYVIMNIKDGSVKEVSPYPGLTNNYANGVERMFAYLKNGVVKPDKSRFASFYVRFKFLRIHDAEGEVLKNVNVEIEPYNKTYDSDYTKRFIAYGSYPKATDKYIYVFCANRYADDLPAGRTELQIWDWDGMPVAKYVLDQRLDCFAISERDGLLYAINNLEEDRIYTYQIPEI